LATTKHLDDPVADAVLTRLYAEDAEQRRAGLPSRARTRNVDVETGRFLSLTARAMGAKRVVEIGSSNGLSTIWIAVAMRATGGSVTGTEILPARAAEGNANLAEAGLADVAVIVPGDARETLAAIDRPIDFVFIDAEKDDYVAHFEAVFPHMRSGGLILADNVTSHDCSVYQAMLRERNDVETVTLPIERGIEFSCKR
jgi:caffeoyl-CoA O-methyltransferase